MIRLIAYDLETCIMQRGFTRDKALILEIGAVDVFHPERQFRCFVNPCEQERTEADFLQGLVSRGARHYPTKKHAENIKYDPSKALPISIALVEFLEFIGTSPVVLTAHNGRSFDDKIVTGALQRCQLEWPKELRFIDSYHDISKKAWPSRRSYKLQNLHKNCCPEHSDLHWHTALDDSIALSHLLGAAARETVATRIERAAEYVEKEHGIDRLNREFSTQFPPRLLLGQRSKAAARRKLRTGGSQKLTRLCLQICLRAPLWITR
jgi:DNA polymerase III epsilon subunit-like protein